MRHTQPWTFTLGTDTTLRALLAKPDGKSQVWTKGPDEALLKLNGAPVAVIGRAGYSSREDVAALAERIVRALNALAD